MERGNSRFVRRGSGIKGTGPIVDDLPTLASHQTGLDLSGSLELHSRIRDTSSHKSPDLPRSALYE